MANFFTDEDVKDLEKSNSPYLDFKEGNNLIRIVSEFTKGYKFGFNDKAQGKELGYPFYKESDPEVKKYGDKLNKTYVMVVWDYATEDLKICKIHQKTILKSIQSYLENEKYGDVRGYDLIINKDSGVSPVKYSCTANPPEELPKEVSDALKGVTITLENVFDKDARVIETK